MITAKQTRREAKQLFRLCLVNGRVDEGRVRKVVQSVLQLRRRGYLALLGYFQRLLKLDHAQHTAEIQSAVPLPADLEIRLQAGLQDVYGSQIGASFVHNPALIGGIRIHVGSDVYDGSVRSGLLHWRRALELPARTEGTYCPDANGNFAFCELG